MKRGNEIYKSTSSFRWPMFLRLLAILHATLIIPSWTCVSASPISERKASLRRLTSTLNTTSSVDDHNTKERSLFEFTPWWKENIHKNLNNDDLFSQDADADDDLFGHSLDDTSITIEDEGTNTTKNCTWYTLSHYIAPDTILYDSIEGVLVGLLVGLFVATCYNLCYYCCLVRCGCCPDDRVYLSKLSRKGRKARRLARPNTRRISRGRRTGCCANLRAWICCCFRKDKDGADGKGAFMLIDNETDSVSACSFDDGMDSDHSSLSLDSALSLEYGDDHLHNEYGEVTSRWDDAKIEEAAKMYFEEEEKAAAEKMLNENGGGASSIKSKSGSKKKSDRSVRSKKSNRSKKSGRSMSGRSRGGRSRRSERSRRTGNGDTSTIFSQSSSILTSDSDESYSSSESSSDSEIEMEDAMMDLDVEHRRVRMEALQMLQRAERRNNGSGSGSG